MSLSGLKRLIVGKSLPTSTHVEERLSNAALAVLSSDARSSVADATEEILLLWYLWVGMR